MTTTTTSQTGGLVVISPSPAAKGGYQYFVRVKVNGVPGDFVLDSGDLVDDLSSLPRFAIATGLDKLAFRPAGHTDPHAVTMSMQIEDSGPMSGEVDLASSSEVPIQDGLIPAATVARRYTMFWDGTDKTLTLTPLPDYQKADISDPMKTLEAKWSPLKVDAVFNGTYKAPLVIDTGTAKGLVLEPSTVNALNLATKGPNVTVQIGSNAVTIKSLPSPFGFNVIGISDFLEIASLYVSRNQAIVMDLNRHPVAPPIAGPVGETIAASINKWPIIAFALAAIVLFVFLHYFAKKL